MAIRCLVAHDAEYMRNLMSDILVKNGFDVVGKACTGTEAVFMYSDLRPDILTMDLNLMELDGISALREIIKLDPRARVVICTSMGEQPQVKDAIKAGAYEVILKPFLEVRVIDAVKKALR